MSEAETQQAGDSKLSGLARKLAVSKEGKGSSNGSLTLKALRRSLARAASELCDLPLAVLAARQTNRNPEDLPDVLSDEHLLVILDGPDGRIGAVTMDAALVTALLQKQTIGQVMGKAPSQRNYTPTDAAMMAGFLERAFSKILSMLEGHSDKVIFSGYRFGAQVDSVRSLVLGLEAEDYRLISVTVDLALGVMQGSLNLILPEPTPEQLGQSGIAAGPSLGSNLGSMRAELSAVLCKMRVPLNELSALKVGDLVPLEQAFLYETDLISIGGQSIAQGKLGQMNGSRAVRLDESRTKLVQDSGAADEGFASGVNGDLPALPAMDDGPTLDLGIAAQDLQDPLDDDLGMPGLGNDFGNDLGGDLAGGLGGDLGGDLGAGLGGDLGNDLGGDLGAGADLGLAMEGAPMGELPALGDGLGDGLGDFGAAPLEAGDALDQFNPDDAAAEISKLAGLD